MATRHPSKLEEAAILDGYLGRLKTLGFAPRRSIEEFRDADDTLTLRRTVVTFARRGGLPGPLPAGADFRPRGIGKRDPRARDEQDKQAAIARAAGHPAGSRSRAA